MKRRDLLKGTLAASAVAAVPARVFAQINPYAARDRTLLEIAREQLARVGSGIWKRDIVGIADFGVHSAERRFYFVDVENERVANYHVSHGDGSDPEHDGWLNRYSNVEGSHCTSRGAYMTRSWYVGKFGTSIRLDGLDPTNSNALPRAIVMHKAGYATRARRPLGLPRLLGGCFPGAEQFNRALIDLSGGRLLYADSLGIQNDGRRVASPELLRREGGGTFERTVPGAF